METTSPEFSHFPANNAGAGEHFIVEDLLDFSNDDVAAFDDLTAISNSSNSSDSPTAIDCCNSSSSSFSSVGNNGGLSFPLAGDQSFPDLPFSTDLCVPYDDLAELEWLSNFVEESFSSEDLQKFQQISGVSAMKTRPEEPLEIHYYQSDPPRPVNSPNPVFAREIPVPGKARSKRSRAAPGNWASRLLLLSSEPTRPEPTLPEPTLPEPIPDKPPKPTKVIISKKKNGLGSGSGPRFGSGSSHELPSGEVRRCLHCASDKTPQWRTGPLGPKTLCNACGVRYKSGRLVPEYRPASSPTFLLTKHSNSHRKVIEIRRQKELIKQQRQHQIIHHHDPNSMIFDQTNSDDYLIHQQIGSEFRQLI